MGFRAFNYGANAVCFQKNDRKYGMICSWATQVDYDKIVMLLGAQSVTAKKIFQRRYHRCECSKCIARGCHEYVRL